MTDNNGFSEILFNLKEILYPFAAELHKVKDSDTGIYFETSPKTNSKGEFFAAVEIKKNYVSFHLMPIYCFPDMADDISPQLRKRMQGKSCFNFKKVEAELFEELSSHVKTGIERYRLEGKL